MWKLNLLTLITGHITRYKGEYTEMVSRYRIPLIVGHRANTISKIRKFLMHGVHVIEMDVVKDPETNELVLQHASEDEMLKQHIEKKHKFIEFILHHLPLIKPRRLSEVLKVISGRANVMIDLKWRGMAKDIAELLTEVDFKGIIYVTSRYHRDLYEVKRLVPKVKTLLSFDDQPVMCAEYVAKLKADGASVRVAFIDKDLINDMHKHGYILAAWTVNDFAVAKYLALLGVDMIITDVPEVILKEFKRMEERELEEELERERIERREVSEEAPIFGGIDHMFGFEFYQSLKKHEREGEG